MFSCSIFDVRTFPVEKLNILVFFDTCPLLSYDSSSGSNSVLYDISYDMSYDRTRIDSAARCHDDTPGYSHIWAAAHAQ